MTHKVKSEQIESCLIVYSALEEFLLNACDFSCGWVLLFLLYVLHCSCSSVQEHTNISIINSDAFCCVCRSSNNDKINCLLECSRCLIKVRKY